MDINEYKPDTDIMIATNRGTYTRSRNTVEMLERHRHICFHQAPGIKLSREQAVHCRRICALSSFRFPALPKQRGTGNFPGIV